MDISPDLVDELARLTVALGDPGVDIADTLGGLAASLRSAVTSYLGLTVHTRLVEPGLSFTMFELGTGADDIEASLLFGAASAGHAAPVSLVFYASSKGAFVDLAADLSWLTGTEDTEIVLDEHLSPPPATTAAALRSASLVDQAVGVLIERGHTPDDARRELDTHAARTGTDRAAAAAVLLAALERHEPDEKESNGSEKC